MMFFHHKFFIHMAFMIDNKMTWMSNISFENVITIKSFQIWLNDVSLQNNVVIQLFYNDSKITIIKLIWIQMDIINYNMRGIDFINNTHIDNIKIIIYVDIIDLWSINIYFTWINYMDSYMFKLIFISKIMMCSKQKCEI